MHFWGFPVWGTWPSPWLAQNQRGRRGKIRQFGRSCMDASIQATELRALSHAVMDCCVMPFESPNSDHYSRRFCVRLHEQCGVRHWAPWVQPAMLRDVGPHKPVIEPLSPKLVLKVEMPTADCRRIFARAFEDIASVFQQRPMCM